MGVVDEVNTSKSFSNQHNQPNEFRCGVSKDTIFIFGTKMGHNGLFFALQGYLKGAQQTSSFGVLHKRCLDKR